MVYNKIKRFWIENIKSKQKRWGVKDDNFSVPNWEDAINNTDDLEQLHGLGVKLREEVAVRNWSIPLAYKTKRKELSQKSWDKLMNLTIEELEQESVSKNALKAAMDNQANVVSEFQNKLKAIVGNNLTNWESKVVKAGSNDKDTTDLQKKVSDLTTERDNLDKEVKQKQQQILNHKCDTPNNDELNQLKEDLKKANQEKEQLQTELNKKDPSAPLPIPQQKEEDKKEEQENLTLTVEELRAKLNSKQKEIRNLQEHLAKKQNSQNSKPEIKFLSGMVVGFLMIAGIGGITYFVRFLQKKKKNSEIKEKEYEFEKKKEEQKVKPKRVLTAVLMMK